ncbi:MAG TPA: hypothetical protein DF613_01970 [Lachnospiraceae bacterium]|nr:hypothetical protein [Lachnospiraceae bacterium]
MKKYGLMMPGINDKDRLVYHMDNGRLYIAHCRGHYGDK